jgi:hypothetical protein
LVKKDNRDYIIKYEDPEHELINVSDEEDLSTAYDLAQTEMNGNIKFIIEFRKPISKKVEPTETVYQIETETHQHQHHHDHERSYEKHC